MPPALLHVPNAFKPVSHIGSMNNTSSTVLNFKNVVYSMRFMSQNPSFFSLSFFTIIFPYIQYIVPNPSFISISFFTILFTNIVPKPKLYDLFKFFQHYISVHFPKTRAKSGIQLVIRYIF